MVRIVVLVTALVIANCHGKLVYKGNSLPDISINIIPKNDKEINLEVKNSPTTPSKPEPVNVDSLENYVTDNEIEDTNNGSVTDNSHNTTEAGVALILTPMLEQGRHAEAREASRVDPSLFLGFKSYSGFFTVNKTYNSNVFFWYFPVENKPVNETPWIIWLQGGPGASSLVGLFEEIGPLQVNSPGSLIKNPHTWLQNHSLLFIDNPVGSGFSFTDHHDGFVKDMATYSSHLFSTVQQFLQVFPELRVAPLYVAGESYAGKYVPALGMQLHLHKNKPGQDVNLQGFMIGNAYVDPQMITQVTQIYYYMGFLEKEQMDLIDPLVKAFQRDIKNHDSVKAKNKWVYLITVLLYVTRLRQAYNLLKNDIPMGRYSTFLGKPEVQRAIHVGEIKYSFINATTNSKMAPDFLSSTKPLFEKLLEHYRVLAYCGQLDLMLPCAFLSENYRTWKWNGTTEFLQAHRSPFEFQDRVAGYSKSGGHLTEVVLRGAGHMVAADAPAQAQDLVTRWTHKQILELRLPKLEGSFIREFIANYSSALYF